MVAIWRSVMLPIGNIKRLQAIKNIHKSLKHYPKISLFITQPVAIFFDLHSEHNLV